MSLCVAMLTLAGLATFLWEDSEVGARLGDFNISKLIRTMKDQPLAAMDIEHCWMNKSVLSIVVRCMREQRCCDLPTKPQLEDQIKVLYAKMAAKKGDASAAKVTEEIESIDSFHLDSDVETKIYCIVTSIKCMVRFLKRAFNRGTSPRDRKFDIF